MSLVTSKCVRSKEEKKRVRSSKVVTIIEDKNIVQNSDMKREKVDATIVEDKNVVQNSDMKRKRMKRAKVDATIIEDKNVVQNSDIKREKVDATIIEDKNVVQNTDMLNIMNPFLFQPRPFLNNFASLHKEEQKEILEMLTLRLMEVQSKDVDVIEVIFNNQKGEGLNRKEECELTYYQSLPKNLCNLPKEKKTSIIQYLFALNCNSLHKDDKLKILNYLDGVEEEIILCVDDDERKKIKDIIIKTMEDFFIERSNAMWESLKKAKQEEWSIDCSFPTDTKFSSELWVVCNHCKDEFSIRSIKRHAALIHKVLNGKVRELYTISSNQFHPKKKEKGVKRSEETTKVYCRSCNKKLSKTSIRNHALFIHKKTGPVDVDVLWRT